VDAIAFGHTHQELAEGHVGNVLLIQPKNWGMSLGRLDFVLESQGSGWKLVSKRAQVIHATAATEADSTIAKIAQPYEEVTQRYLNTPVADAEQAMDGRLARVEDTPILDAVQIVQMHYAHADVSFASMFNPSVAVPKGPVTVRQIAALYVYDNELYAVEGTGAMVKAALENAARYFMPCRDAKCEPPLISSKVMGFNFDVAQGVTYDLNLTRPEGDRIQNLSWHGKPLQPQQKLRIAVNNYRAGGSAGYDMFRAAKIVWRSNEEIRDMIIRYYTERTKLPAAADGNWKITPEAARRNLEKQALAERRPNTM
jgi:2',3'-cyclic-nucleotide 2'-phosphodiesterase/3'-nucleotidase